jgi:homoserine kinase
MSIPSGSIAGSFRIRLPATSANLGPGFDAAAVALDFHLDVEAVPANDFSVHVTGRDAERCARLDDNLVLNIYRRLMDENDRPIVPLAIRMVNRVPLGMGCGSSATGRLAAIAMAVHFGRIGWCDEQILEEASALEGHPDNAAACWLGGFVSAATDGRTVHVARVLAPAEWWAIVVLPPEPLATSKARAILPATYARADVVANLQAVGLLGLAFAQGRGDLLKAAMRDRIHQPYRATICPMLPPLLPLAGSHGILSAALSGAGPAVLVIVEGKANLAQASAAIRAALQEMPEPELIVCRFGVEGARETRRG